MVELQRGRVCPAACAAGLFYYKKYGHVLKNVKTPWFVLTLNTIKISRHRRSQRLLYKHLRPLLIHSLSNPLIVPTALQRRHAQTVRVSTSSYKINYVIMIKSFLNPEGHQNPCSGSKVPANFTEGRIRPIGGASAGEGLPCSLRRRLV